MSSHSRDQSAVMWDRDRIESFLEVQIDFLAWFPDNPIGIYIIEKI